MEALPQSLRGLGVPLKTRIAKRDSGRSLLDVWNALGIPPHPALCYIVTAPLDLDIVVQAPLVLTRSARYRNSRMVEPDATRIHIGGVIRDRQGRPLAGISVRLENGVEASITDGEGRFVLRGVPAGRVGLNVSGEGKTRKHVEVNVPAESYEIVLDE